MTAIEATAGTAKTLVDGSLRLTIEFSAKDAQQAFNAFCEQGAKLAVVRLKDGYYVEQMKFQEPPLELAEPEEKVTLPYGVDGLKKTSEETIEKFKINGRPASCWADFQTKNPVFQKFIGETVNRPCSNEISCNQYLKSVICVDEKKEIDRDLVKLANFKSVLSTFGQWCAKNGIGELPPVSREQAINYLGGSLDEDEGLSLANER